MDPYTPPPTGAAARPIIVDPRNHITEDAYRLAPELLGTPLARPWRRGVAMAVDGLLIALLSNATGVLFGFALALILFRVSATSASAGYLRRSMRLMFRFGGAVTLFIATVVGWDGATDWVEERGREEVTARLNEDRNVEMSFDGIQGLSTLRSAADFARFPDSENEAVARRRAERMAMLLREGGEDDAEIADALREIAGSRADRPWLRAAVDSVTAQLAASASATSADAAPAATPEALAAELLAAAERGDAAGADAVRGELALLLAADTLQELNEELGEEREERKAVAARLRRAEEAAEEGPGVVASLRRLADDIGFGFGWAGLYFTACVALFRGQTPGKRILRIRVIRLDGQPLGWWASFERFGGYAAGVATGLLGFFQIYWDRNRQAVHDKICETVVVND